MFNFWSSKVPQPDLSDWRQDISFKVNGKQINVKSGEATPDVPLSTFLRTRLNLFGTKFMCMEGGCGVCVVSIKRLHPVRRVFDQFSVNSCLYPVLACDGAEIETIEFLKDSTAGYHEVSKRLAHFNGSQCGYCSPAMVMSMYSLMQRQNGRVTMGDVEKSLGGQLCRCTGYRPILDAFKSLSLDADPDLKDYCVDIEDMPVCKSTGQPCASKCDPEVVRKCFPSRSVAADAVEWRKAVDFQDIFEIFAVIGDRKYMLVGGNTAHGVYRRPQDIQVFIDVNNVPQLKTRCANSSSLEIGGGVTLTELIDILNDVTSKNQQHFGYLKKLVIHIELIASTSIRNTGTIAGNLMTKHAHNEFPSDLFLMLETVGAQVVVAKGSTSSDLETTTVAGFLGLDMSKKVICKIILPALNSDSFELKTYKITPRVQNAHAYENAGFLLEFSTRANGTVNKNVIKSARICYGGINPTFVHATATEAALTGSNLYENTTIQRALESLKTEINPDWVLPDASPEFRKLLALGLFYKTVLGTAPQSIVINPKFKSGGELIKRSLSSGTQKFDTVEKNYPLTQPVMKLEALMQTSGEAVFQNDVHHRQDEDLWCAFVLATEINASITMIDPSAALALEGVVAFYSAKDIPGKNLFTGPGIIFIEEVEELFVGDRVRHHSQPAGVIVANSYDLAHKAAALVTIQYARPERRENKVLLSIKDVLADETEKMERMVRTEMTNQTDNEMIFDHIVAAVDFTGQFEIPAQYHFTMEPHTTICEIKEDGMDIFSSTQSIDSVQFGVANVLNWPAHKLNIEVRRLGGAYGSKISRATHAACACALACYHLKRRVRFVMSIEQMMSALGKRNAAMNDYRLRVTEEGVIQTLHSDFFSDFGCTLNEDGTGNFQSSFRNVYQTDRWTTTVTKVVTDAPSSTWTRAPGDLEGIALIENIFEHIAFATQKDPVDVRLANLNNGTRLPDMLRKFIQDIEYRRRQQDILDFNTANRWKKRGLAVVPMRYHLNYFGCFAAIVSIYHIDGTVSIAHGGIEMGQGLNTKACQVAAHILKIPLELVTTKPSREYVSPNALPTGGSQTSELICYATIKACEELNRRLQPVRDSAPANTQWKDLVKMAYGTAVDLSSRQSWRTNETQDYDIFGCSACEVELDVLTGNTLLRRVDILEDTGESMSPLVDLGQVEGGFVMGLGYWMNEHLVYNKQSGQLLSNRTWHYKVPGAMDIPVDFRISFLQKAPNPFGVLRSKATGEPSICMACVSLFAVRHAVAAARKDNGLAREWFNIPIPCTPENLLPLIGNKSTDFNI